MVLALMQYVKEVLCRRDIFMTKMTTVSHIHIHAKDLDSIERYYRKHVPAARPVMFDLPWTGIRALYVVQDPVDIEYIEAPDPDFGWGLIMKDSPLGINCVSLRVPNVDEAVAEMESRGFETLVQVYFGQVREALVECKPLQLRFELCSYPGGDNLAAVNMPGQMREVILGREYVP